MDLMKQPKAVAMCKNCGEQIYLQGTIWGHVDWIQCTRAVAEPDMATIVENKQPLEL